MAIWQFYLEAVPKQSIENLDTDIPEKIMVSTDDGFFSADTEKYWNAAEVSLGKVIQRIDSIVERARWSNNSDSFSWKSPQVTLKPDRSNPYEVLNATDNDAYLTIDMNTGYIKHLHLRADLREENLLFLKQVVELGKKLDWMFMDRKGFLVEANLQQVIEQVKLSNALRFLKDPTQFLDDLSGEVGIE
jgi:hypothetical protein